MNGKSGIHVKTKGFADVVTQQLGFPPGRHTGWHSHPGPVLVTANEEESAG